MDAAYLNSTHIYKIVKSNVPHYFVSTYKKKDSKMILGEMLNLYKSNFMVFISSIHVFVIFTIYFKCINTIDIFEFFEH